MKKLKYMTFLLLSASLFSPSVSAYTKNETVYKKLNDDGTSAKTVVTNQIVGRAGEEIEDESELLDLLTLNKKKDLKIDGGSLKWKSDGTPLFYQGTIQKQDDMEITIQYYLNGKEKKAKEIIGGKGHVKIVYTLKNKMKNTVLVNGKKEVLYTPFVVTFGTILKPENAENITISNGKMINNGNRYMVAALALPGLYESLKIPSFQKLDEIVLEYDTNDFALSQVYFVATPKLLEEKDITLFEDTREMLGSLDTLKVSMQALEEGTGKLENGIGFVSENTEKLTSSLKSVLSAINQLQNGQGAITDGLNALVHSLQVFKIQLNQSIDLTDMIALKEKNADTIMQLKIANTQIENLLPPNLGNATQEQMMLKQTYEANIKLIALLEGNNMAIENTLAALSSLQNQITSVIAQLETGASSLYEASGKMQVGMRALKEGILQIYEGSLALAEGTNALKEGSIEVNNGMHRINKEGIEKLISSKNTIQNYTDKIEALLDLSKKYNGYASKNSEGTHFIYTVPSFKK